MPQAFGKFKKNFTLNNSVCCGCNTYFSQNLELRLARDSLEALDRITGGTVRPKSLAKFPFAKTQLTISEGDYLGLKVRIVLNEETPNVVPLPQVGFLSEGETEWVYLTLNELNDNAVISPTDIAANGIRIIAPSDEVTMQLVKSLNERRISFQRQGELRPPTTEDGDIEVEISGQIDQIIKRCVSKVLFNYLAFSAGHDFAIDESFNTIREFVRYDKVPSYQLVAVSNDPILHTDTSSLRQTDGHLVTINWTGDNHHIIGQISLFNRITYRVSLARDFQGIWRPICRGHMFDIQSRTISELLASSLIL